MIPILFRCFFIVIGSYSIADHSLPLPIAEYFNSLYFGRKQFLTILGMYLTIFLTILKIFKFERLHSFLYPFGLCAEMTITLVFWIMYIFVPNLLIFEVPGYKYNSSICLHLVHHFLPLLILCFEGFYTDLENISFIKVFFLTPIYYLIAYLAYKLNNKWPYPFLEQISHLLRILIFILYSLIGIYLGKLYVKYCILLKNKFRRKNDNKCTEESKERKNK